jgi:hypothetical protein
MPLSARTTVAVLALTASPALACPGLNWEGPSNYGTINLATGHGIDPFTIPLRAGGNWNLRSCGLDAEALTGFEGDGLVNHTPDLTLNWRSEAPRIAFTTEFEEDTFLLIRDPEGGWHFDDNGRGQNPLVVLTDTPGGNYAIWIGTHGSTTFTRPGKLIITETGP